MKQFVQKIIWFMAISSHQAFAEIATPDVQIREGYVREMPPGQQNTAAFMQLKNGGDKPVMIVRVESPRATSVELHQHIHANGMMRMQAVPSVTIPAKDKFVFKSGDYHVMLLGVTPAVKAGETVALVFVTDSGARIAADLPVKPITAVKSTAAADSAQGEHAAHH